MKKILLTIPIILLLVGCSSTQESFSALFDRLEFDENEGGCVTLQTTVDLNNNPLVNSNTQVTYKKVKPTESDTDPVCP